MDSNALRAIIERYPRLNLAHLPTPFERMERLQAWLGVDNLWVKRDDLTGLGMGGNKVRALEFIIPDALALQGDVLVTAGVIQSNSVRQVAAAAAKHGFGCHFGMIVDRVSEIDRDYKQSGNLLLDYLYGATHEVMSFRDDRSRRLSEIAARLSTEGRKPYVVPYGCANRLGAMGYLNAALEVAIQAEASDVRLTHVVHASGTGGTQAGLIAGFAALGLDIEVIGVDIDAEPEGVHRRVATILRELAIEIGLDFASLERRIIVEPNYSAGAYGVAEARTVEAIEIAAKYEGIIVDPVYSGKGLAGLVGLVRQKRFTKDDRVLFFHTGGSPAIYAYRSLFPEFT
ncbi:L-cysteate sulfo-lyase [Mesorhizobium robiniae]|uniref:L-cysteate sulfo-lyase n=1 Tax=Mesorhizobium robiniae TaxID=559315 RepID=A0ABV2GNL6_9HYPH